MRPSLKNTSIHFNPKSAIRIPVVSAISMMSPKRKNVSLMAVPVFRIIFLSIALFRRNISSADR